MNAARVLQEEMMKRRGFTLVELLVVIAIIGILVALLLPAVNSARAAARRTQCKNQIRQLALACNTYAEANKALPHGGKRSNQLSWISYILPYIEEKAIYDQMISTNCFKDGQAGTAGPNNAGLDASGNPAIIHNPSYYSATYSIKTLLCPDQSNPYALKTGHWLSDHATTGTKQYTSHYQGVSGAAANDNPDDPVLTTTNNINPATGKPYTYVHHGRDGFATNGLLGASGDFSPAGTNNYGGAKLSPVKLKSIPDGISRTLMIGEASNSVSMNLDIPGVTPLFDPWVRGIFGNTITHSANNLTMQAKQVVFGINYVIPSTVVANRRPFSSNHTGGAHFTTGDSAVTFINEDIDIVIYRALATRNGSENVNLP